MNIIRIIIFLVLFLVIYFLYKPKDIINENSVSKTILNSLSNTPFSNSYPSSSSYTVSN